MAYLVKVNQVNRTYTIKRIERKIVVGRSGRRGLPGPQGEPGVGVPTGGTTGQILAKNSNTNYDTEWVNQAADAVTSVNSQTGVVVLDTDDIADTATNRYTDDTAIARLANTSGTNTGDQDLSGLVPYTGATSDVNLGTYKITTSAVQANSSAGGAIKSSSGANVAEFGAGGGQNITFEDGVKLNAGTASRILATDASKNIQYLDTTTYPSLTELSYLKGTTSAVQTQVDAKVAKAGDTMTGTLTTSGALVATGNYSAIPATPGVYAGIPTGLSPRFTMAPSSGSVRAVDNNVGTIRFINSTSGTIQMISNSVGLFAFGPSLFGLDPTHTLTLPSTATGIALYNTADQTTNYERVRQYWTGNVYNIYGEIAGTGSVRVIRLSAFGNATQALQLNATSTSGFIQAIGTSSTASAIVLNASGTLSSSSGVQYGITVQPTLNQSSTAGYTALLVNPTETATGSGTKLLADFQVGGTSLVRISNAGAVTAPLVINTSNAVTVAAGAATVPVTRQLTTVTNNAASAVTITISTSGAVDGQRLVVRFYDFSAAAQTISWVNTENSTTSVPTASNGSTTLPLNVGFQYNSATSKWRCLAVA